MKKNFISSNLLAVFALLFIWGALSSCTAVPTATNLMIDNKMNSALAGADVQEVLAKYGTPHYRLVIPRPKDMVEIWGYDMGNYWVNDAVFLVFRNDSLVGVSKHPYEMLQTMHSLRIFGEGAIFSQPTKRLSAENSAASYTQNQAGSSLREKMQAASSRPPKN